MRLLVLMFHRARAGRDGNAAEMLDAHFALVARDYQNVLPGEPLAPDRLNVCLSFDDAYFDFYEIVFPLLKKHDLRALLAVPPFFVRERTEATPEERLRLNRDQAFARPSRGGFCTWPELEEMTASGHVSVAAHGYAHRALDSLDADLDTEVHAPQTILGSRLGQEVTSFVFPYGRFSRPALSETRQRYRYAFRIGGALNDGWDGRVLYRVSADAMTSPDAPFSAPRLAAGRLRSMWNRARRR